MEWGRRDVGYQAGAWIAFGAALAGVAGALTGLLFVAVSIKSEALARSRNLSSRAAQTLVLFMIAVLIGLLVVTPQPRIALGCELIALAALSGVVLRFLDRRAGSAGENANQAERYVERFSPNLVTAVLVCVAGVTLAIRAGGGLYWLLPAAVASLLGGVISAWLFLIRVTG
jgi:hypothetical protein